MKKNCRKIKNSCKIRKKLLRKFEKILEKKKKNSMKIRKNYPENQKISLKKKIFGKKRIFWENWKKIFRKN